ncbi:MAG: MFS transporter [Rhodoglobus sp.]
MTVTEPIPILGERVLWRDTFISLRTRNYRLYVISQLLANTAGWMHRIATDWLVLELTGNVALVGITVALQFGPVLLFGPWGGVIADRYNKRRLLIFTQASSAVLCALLAVLTIVGVIQLWEIYLIVLLLGLLVVVDSPTRSSFVSEMVGQQRLRNAISINASIFHLGGLIGPAVSGVLIAIVGAGWSIAVNSFALFAVVAALLAMRIAELTPSPMVERTKGQIREAIAYVRKKPAIFWSLVTLSFVSVFGMSLPILLAAMAQNVFDTGSAGYGVYNSIVAIGALSGAVLSTRRRTLRLRTIVIAASAYGLLQFAAGFSPWYIAFLVVLPGIGLARLLFATAAESMTQLSSNPAIRGRVMSLYGMVMIGGQAIGGPLMGTIAEHLGARVALMISGGVPAVAAIVIALVLARSGKLRLRVSLNRRDSFIAIVSRKKRPRAATA